MNGIIQWVVANKALILAVLLGVSEVLAVIPSVKANSIFQLIAGWLQKNKPAEQA